LERSDEETIVEGCGKQLSSNGNIRQETLKIAGREQRHVSIVYPVSLARALVLLRIDALKPNSELLNADDRDGACVKGVGTEYYKYIAL
jgi:hypothetical protein